MRLQRGPPPAERDVGGCFPPRALSSVAAPHGGVSFGTKRLCRRRQRGGLLCRRRRRCCCSAKAVQGGPLPPLTRKHEGWAGNEGGTVDGSRFINGSHARLHLGVI